MAQVSVPSLSISVVAYGAVGKVEPKKGTQKGNPKREPNPVTWPGISVSANVRRASARSFSPMWANVSYTSAWSCSKVAAPGDHAMGLALNEPPWCMSGRPRDGSNKRHHV